MNKSQNCKRIIRFTLKIGKILSLVGTAVCLLTFFFSCEKDHSAISHGTPPPPKPEITLTLAEEPALTEIYLKLKMKNVQFPQVFSITRNGAAVLTDTMTTTDTTVVDTGPTPSTAYDYKAYRLVNGQKSDSASLQTITMDTTSHEFQWEILTFGTSGSSVLYDVAIINENDIWCVGEIYADSAQPWLPYNAVHWDGQQWELKRIKTLACGGVDYPPIIAVFAFSSNDVLFAHIDGSITHYDGNNFINDCSLINQLNGSVNKMWGRSRNDLYVVSGNGFIAHYNGSSWQKIESGITLPIQDIWGAENPHTQEYIILCVASNKYLNEGKALLQIVDSQIYPLPDDSLSWSLSGLWFVHKRKYYIVGAGIFQKDTLLSNSPWGRFAPGQVTNYYTNRIRGTGINDVVAAGAFGEIVHFNGGTWKNYLNLTQLNFGAYFSVDIKNDLIVAVGQELAQGVIAIGKR